MFSPPLQILKEINVNEKQLFGPGPSNIAFETKNALTLPLLGYMNNQFLEV